ncbi:MAG: HEAT repeat domain-containing protein [Nannocystaceae bacterium]
MSDSYLAALTRLAEDPATPPAVLRQLAAAPAELPELPRAVVKNPAAPLELLLSLAGRVDVLEHPRLLAALADPIGAGLVDADAEHPIWSALEFVSADPRCPLALLELTRGELGMGVAIGLVENPKATPELLRHVAETWLAELLDYDCGPEVWERLAEHPALPEELALAWARDPETYPAVLTRLMPRLPGAVLHDLSHETDTRLRDDARLELARRDPEYAAGLLERGERHLQTVVAAELAAPELAARCAAHPDREVRRAALRNPALASAVIEAILAGDSDVREAAVAHPSVSPARLAALADDADRWVRRAVSLRADATPATLERLCHDPDPLVRGTAALHERTPLAGLLSLCADPEVDHRARLVHRCPRHPALLAALLRDPSPDVRALIARARWIDDATARALADDPAPTVRAALAQNPAAPRAILERLVDDRERSVRDEVHRNLARRLAAQLGGDGPISRTG